MAYITTDNITSINAELTNFCNAACPMCARHHIDGVLLEGKVNNQHTSLQFLKDKIGINIIKKLRNFTSCGNFGDGAMNPECLSIYKWIRDINPTINLVLHTNGGARNTDFWIGMAKAKVTVVFAIDGLENTNHLYRRNVKWQKLMDNVRAFIGAGGKAGWEMLIFKHNEDQIDECRKFANRLGFDWFNYKQSARWSDFDSKGEWKELDRIQVDDYYIEKSTSIKAPTIGNGGNSQKDNNVDIQSKKIKCKAHRPESNWAEIYVAVNGDVSPCCWLGDLRLHESKNIIKNYNAVNLNYTPLQEILDGHYFKELEKGIKGANNAYRLHTCYMTCGVNR